MIHCRQAAPIKISLQQTGIKDSWTIDKLRQDATLNNGKIRLGVLLYAIIFELKLRRN